jgi:carbon monoxide dehydrogenase subunit G
MQTIAISRDLDAPPDRVRALIADTEAFTAAGGFDGVTVDGDRIHLTNGVGIATIELTLAIEEDEEAALAYRQVDGIFGEMETRYTVSERNGGSTVTGETSFNLDIALVGQFLDATVIKRQRRREIESQFDWLEEQLREES